MQKTLKLYIWKISNELVSGIAFAYADNVKQARLLIRKKIRDEALYDTSTAKELRETPQEVMDIEGFYYFRRH